MGKRQRRRTREQGRDKAVESKRLLYPSATNPLVEIHITPEAPEELHEICASYWEFAEPGVWARPVSAIGSGASKIAKENSFASLLTVTCPGCQSSLTVTTRSEMAAVGVWGNGLFPTMPVTGKYHCLDCVNASKEARAREAEHARVVEKERTERRVKNASQWLTGEAEVDAASDSPSARAALVLLAAIGIMQSADKESVGPMNKAKYTFTGTGDGDVEALKELHGKRWMVPTFPATVGDFGFDENDRVTGVYVAQAPWRLPVWLGIGGDAQTIARDTVEFILEEEIGLAGLQDQVLDLEADLVVRYLGGLLAHKYNEAPIPDDRLPEAFQTARDALDAGFTVGQMVAVAWSAVSRSAAWGARTPWVKPGMVSSAAVTNLAKGVGYAKDRPVVEYELPNWMATPAILPIGRHILRRIEKAEADYSALRALQQRIKERPPVEFYDELEDAFPKSVSAPVDEGPTDLLDFIAQREPADDHSPLLTCALVSAEGEIEITTLTMNRMKEIAGAPSGVDRIFVEGTPTINAYCTDLAENGVHGFNDIAGEMLRLIGGDPTPPRGTIAFFQVRQGSHQALSLDTEHQELLAVAHRVATRHVNDEFISREGR
ncbi:hypothetical protein ABT093_24115 [Kitasatospora sp. NPDC002551]|uniref:hypothetical protein n=1 Tax=Kitasatospora sp. NPDC002551 TaxID=3154539 RepID=UPI003333BE0E